MYTRIECYLNDILRQVASREVAALHFNLYEDGNHQWSMELVGTAAFDLENQDWCCDEIFDFGTRVSPFIWKQKAEWNEILDEMAKHLTVYLEQGRYAAVLKKYQGISIGFVEGDIKLLFIP